MIKSEDFSHSDTHHQYATRCKNCETEITYLANKRAECDYGRFTDVLSHIFNNSWLTLQWCEECNMETVQELLAVTKKKE